MSITTALDPNQKDSLAAQLASPFSTAVKKSGERGPDFPGGFVITEFIDGIPQDGPEALDTRVILQGINMPMQPFEWGSEQRITKEYYPGNPEPAVQIMGSKQTDVTIHGRFKDKHYKQLNYYGAAYQLALQCDQMVQRGNLCKFAMNGQTGSWVRYGFLEKSHFKMNKVSWIDYELALFIVSEHQPINNYFTAPDKSQPDTLNSGLIAAAQSFASTYSAIPTSMPASISDKFNSLLNTVSAPIALVTNFVGQIISDAKSVADSAHRALGLIKNAKATISKFQRDVAGIGHSFSTLSVSGNSAGQHNDTHKNISHLTDAVHASFALSDLLKRLETQILAISQTIPKARYKVQANDTLQRISVRFYGVADNWETIYTHNNLTSTVLLPGQVLEIPKL